MTVSEKTPTVFTESQDGVLRIVINRPDKKNALTFDMYKALTEAVRQGEEDPRTRVMLIHGTQDCFAAGNDLKDFLESPPKDEFSPAFRFLGAISEARKPIVAAVNGPAVGIGTTMLLHCDLVYAGPNTRFQMPFINLGLVPEGASSLLLPQMAGHQTAAELLLLGEPFSAERAREIGLVNAICPETELLQHASDQAQKLAAKPLTSLLLTKALLRKSSMTQIKETMSEEIRLIIERLSSPEASEAFTAFFERRKPDFSRFQ